MSIASNPDLVATPAAVEPPLVEMRDMFVAFGGVHAVQNVWRGSAGGRGSGCGRRQRRRQDHSDAGPVGVRIRRTRARY